MGTEGGMVETQFKKMSTEKKVAFITGGNRGLGLQTARELGKLGIVVVIGSRDPEKGKTAAATLRSEGIAAESLRCDVTKPEDHRAVRDHFERRYGKLDILINNAAVMMEGENSSADARVNRTSTVSSAILHETFEVNFFALVALTKTLLPLVRKAPCGRIVNLSSILGSLTLQSDPGSHIYPHKVFAYDASKTALNAFTVHLAHELRDSPIKVNSAHPGWVKPIWAVPAPIWKSLREGKPAHNWPRFRQTARPAAISIWANRCPGNSTTTKEISHVEKSQNLVCHRDLTRVGPRAGQGGPCKRRFVIGTTRDGDSGLPSGSHRLHVLPLELQSADQARTAIVRAHALHGRLDVIVNNAGYGLLGAIEEARDSRSPPRF